LDYWATANYYDGLPNANPTWTYDAAANRTDSACDNLNQTTAISGTAVTTDILGNRLVYGSSTYSWDALNRLTSLAKSGSTTNYEYRADGMRTHKSNGSTFTEYFHDAQMSMEDSAVNGSNLTVTRYGLGARGIDYEEVATGTYTNGTTRSVGSFTNVGFPIYDAHGNMVATLARFGSTFTLNNKRSFDAWGQIRNGAQTGDPKNRYCGSLGHQHDDESGLIYMRARYYEPGSGRFICEDSDRDGINWFSYTSNDPVNLIDSDGKEASYYYSSLAVAFMLVVMSTLCPTPLSSLACIIAACVATARALSEGGIVSKGVMQLLYGATFIPLFTGVQLARKKLSENAATNIISGVVAVYELALISAMAYAIVGA